MVKCCEFGCTQEAEGGFQPETPVPNEFSQSPQAATPAPVFWCDAHKESVLAGISEPGEMLTEADVRSL